MTDAKNSPSPFRISHPHSVVVIGAGISGLCTAYFLRQRGFQVTVVERDESVGGKIKTVRENGWLVELGPNSALEITPLFHKLFEELGILPQQVYADESAKKRYILRNGRLYPVPLTPTAVVRSRLLSWPGKFRLLREPFAGRAAKEESVAEFIERRLGREFLDYVINPFVAGVYAGNPENLSMQAAFPEVYSLEEKHGGLLKGMMNGKKQRSRTRANTRRMFSFIDGMQTFPMSLARSLEKAILLNADAEHIIPIRVGPRSIYTVSFTQGNMRKKVEADAVVLSAPAYATAGIIRAIDPEMAKTLSSIPYAPVAAVYLGFKISQIGRPLDGFGFLVPAKEGRNTLGTVWSSAIFPHRAPDGWAALTTFVGGARQSQLVGLNDSQLQQIVLSDLKSTMGIEGDPVFAKITRWQRAIPQYIIGYFNILKSIERFEQNFRGAFLCSNYRGGVALGDCVMNAEKITERVMMHLS